MCGGCGQPLRAADRGATVFAGATTPAASAGVDSQDFGVVAHDAPTFLGQEEDPAAPSFPFPGDVAAAPSDGNVAWPGVAQGGRAKARGGAPRTSSVPWWRIPMIVAIVLFVLVGGVVGAWAVVIQPSMHSDFDVHMQSVLDSSINETFHVKVAAGQHTIPATTFNGYVKTLVPQDSAVSNIKLSFAKGQEIVTYSFGGSSGTVTTNLGVVGGRVVARGTVVDCPLCLIESGDQMEATFNDPFRLYIPASVKITNIQTISDALVFTVGS